MLKLLLLTCGTNANFHIVKILKEQFSSQFFVVGTDINRRWEIPTSVYLDKFYQVPPTLDKDYYAEILSICKTEDIDFLLPSFDADQLLFFDGNQDLAQLGVKSLGIGQSVTEIYRNKKLMNTFLVSNGLPVPQTYRTKDISINQNYFVKPQNGVGSIGARLMSGREILKENDDSLVIEEICKGPEITLECFLYNGKVYSVGRERLATKSGVCTKAKVTDYPELTKIAQHFAEVADSLPHIFNLQFMQNSEDKYVITDVNLRTAGGMSLSYATGWDEVSALANVLLGNTEDEVVKYINYLQDTFYVMRAYTDIVTKTVQKRIAFDLDGTLLDSRKRHEVVMQDVLRKYNLSLDVKGMVDYKSDGKNNVAWLCSQGVDSDLAKQIQASWVSLIEQDEYLQADTLYSGIIQYLTKLVNDNDLYLVTARTHSEGVLSQIKKFGLNRMFSKIEVVSPFGAKQAKADFLRKNNIDLMIGDTEVDYEASLLADCDFQASLQGFRSKSFWSKYKVKVWEAVP